MSCDPSKHIMTSLVGVLSCVFTLLSPRRNAVNRVAPGRLGLPSKGAPRKRRLAGVRLQGLQYDLPYIRLARNALQVVGDGMPRQHSP